MLADEVFHVVKIVTNLNELGTSKGAAYNAAQTKLNSCAMGKA